MDARSRQAVRRAGCVVIVGTAVVMLGLGVHHELQVIDVLKKPQVVSQQTINIREEECLYRAIRSQVPDGADVYVISRDWHYTQRLAELSTGWAVPQADLASARYELAIVPAQGHCGGFMLKVSRV